MAGAPAFGGGVAREADVMRGERRLAIDIVIPVYNEESVVAEFHRRLMDVVTPLRREHQVRITYVNDGSIDHTDAELLKLANDDPDVTILELSRNFGHQAALTAGLDCARGDVVITMDGDGQHPPELITDMVALHQTGYDVVLTQRVAADLSRFKRWSSAAFYRLLGTIGSTRITAGSADFRLVARPVLEALRQMREYHRFLRGMVAWAGYRTVVLPYAERARIGGRPKYSLGGMARLAADATFSFSLVPLKIALVIGVGFLVLAAAEVVYVMSFFLTGRQHLLAPGWSSLMFMLLIVGAALMISLGLVGIYVGYIFQEVKRRPVYLIRTMHGHADDPPRAEDGGTR
jgi:polyisoprenyl-phosphate glycosyltransferase